MERAFVVFDSRGGGELLPDEVYDLLTGHSVGWDDERADCAIDAMPLSKRGTIQLRAFLYGWARLCVDDLRGHHIFIPAEGTEEEAMAEMTLHGVLAHGDKERLLEALTGSRWEQDCDALFEEQCGRLTQEAPSPAPQLLRKAMFLWHPDKVRQLLHPAFPGDAAAVAARVRYAERKYTRLARCWHRRAAG